MLPGKAALQGSHLLFNFFFILPAEVGIRFQYREKAMRVVHEPLSGHFLEYLRIVCPEFANAFDGFCEIKARQGISFVEPGLKDIAHQSDAVGIRAAGDFLAVKFDLVQNAFNQFPVKSFLHNLFQRLKNQFFNFRDVFVLYVAQARAKHQLL